MLERFMTGDESRFLISLLLCLIAGLIMGIERELKHKEAGMRTHVFVITGAMIFTFLSSLVDLSSPSRIASNIVIGIGFLGAGMILREKEKIRNLTTAASIWYAAAIGMLIGYQFYLIALIATLFTILVSFIPGINKHE